MQPALPMEFTTMCEEQRVCSGSEDGVGGNAVDDDGDQVDDGQYMPSKTSSQKSKTIVKLKFDK
jgi:hypothetical protein